MLVVSSCTRSPSRSSLKANAQSQGLNHKEIRREEVFSEERIIGFLREAEARISINGLCRQHGFSEALDYL